MSKIFKKLVLILVTFMPITKASIKDNGLLKQVFYIYYLISFKNNKIWSLFNSSSYVNVIILAYLDKLGLIIYHINIKA